VSEQYNWQVRAERPSEQGRAAFAAGRAYFGLGDQSPGHYRRHRVQQLSGVEIALVLSNAGQKASGISARSSQIARDLICPGVNSCQRCFCAK